MSSEGDLLWDFISNIPEKRENLNNITEICSGIELEKIVC
jgi:hypothetical protein